VVISLERGADLHMAQLMPLPLAVSCSSKIQIGFTFLVQAHLGSPGKRAVKRVCVCVCQVILCLFLICIQYMQLSVCVKCHFIFWPHSMHGTDAAVGIATPVTLSVVCVSAYLSVLST